MKPQTKKWLLIGSSLAVIGGVAYYFWKKKGENSGDSVGETKNPDTTPATATPKTNATPNVVNSTASVPTRPDNVTNFQKFANAKGWSPRLVEDGQYGAKTAAAYGQLGAAYNQTIGGVATGVAKRTPVNTLMVSSPEKIVGKTVYAINAGSTLYDINMKAVGRTRKDEKIGMVTSTKRTSSGDYILTGKTPIGGYFTIPSSAVYYLN